MKTLYKKSIVLYISLAVMFMIVGTASASTPEDVETTQHVSPVIGVIIMVAITVILAAAIGSSVFGQGTTDDNQVLPSSTTP